MITSLTDIAVFAALLLAMEYHKRWEVKNTIDELKAHLLGRKTPIRSLNPREIVQEIYGWLPGHWAVRSLMFQVADAPKGGRPKGDRAQISPLRLSFTGTLNVVRRAVLKLSAFATGRNTFFFTWLVREILDEQIPEPEGRSNSRVVKKTRVKGLPKNPYTRQYSSVRAEQYEFPVCRDVACNVSCIG